MAGDPDDKKRTPLRLVSQEEADAAQAAGEELSDLGDFREWDSFRWADDPSGYIVWARRISEALMDYARGVAAMPDPYWFLRGFMSRWRRLHRGLVSRFLERRAHFEWTKNQNYDLARQLMLYAKAIDAGRDLNPDGSFTDGMEDVVGLCPNCTLPVYANALVSFEAPRPAAYIQHLHTIYRCEGCGRAGPAKDLKTPTDHDRT